MPITRDASGNSRFCNIRDLCDSVRPEDFFPSAELDRRHAEARRRVLEAVRFAAVPLSGRGTCHEVRGIGPRPRHLAEFVDRYDGRRARRLRKQRRQRLAPNEPRLRSPQPISKRRAALFSGTDIPTGYFKQEYGCRVGPEERSQFVEMMRWWLLETAISQMYGDDEIGRINGVWYVSVIVMDAHPSARQQRQRKSAQSSHRVKHDDRSFHGRPNRDRARLAA